MIEQFIEGLYNNIVEGNMKLYRQFFLYDPNEEGTIEYWKNAIAFYDKLDDMDKEILFSIIKSTIVDTVSNVLAVLDGYEDIDRIDVQVKLNGQENDSKLQDAFLTYVEDLDELISKENTMRTVGLKLESSVFTAPIAKIIRKYQDLSISQIKQIVLNNEYVFKCDIIHANGIRTILHIKDDLSKEGIISYIYVEGKLTNEEYLNNLLVSYKQTENQVEEEMDREVL